MKKILSIMLIVLTSKAIFANGFGGGIVGTGKLQGQLERLNLSENQLGNTLNFEIIRNETSLIPSKLIQFNIDDVEEVTLKDGSVVKTYEILELMKK